MMNKLLMNIQLLGLLFVMMSIGAVSRADTELQIVADGKSTFAIVIPQKPPLSVQQAAREMQKDIQLSTGIVLPVVNDSDAVNSPFISLGSTVQAKSAHLAVDGIADGGFRIVTKDKNVYILGRDTTAVFTTTRDWDGAFNKIQLHPEIPGPAFTQDGGFSNGTANGVYTFLEDYLGVRWLLPGALGRDVPTKSTFKLGEIDRTETPEFIYRNLAYTLASPAVDEWRAHQKLGFSFRYNFNHNWHQVVPQSMFKEHPEWFAMIDGKRTAGRPAAYKLETTNPELIKYFAGKAVEALKTDPAANTFSLSPSDGRDWSESPASKALYDPPPAGSGYPSVTPLILKWYRDVSNQVAKQYPQGKLGGYIYQDYINPPQKSEMSLPDNFVPMIAPSFDYGFALYRAETRQRFDSVMSDWAKVAPHRWFYFDLPTRIFHNDSGMLVPPATGILNFIFPRLMKNHIQGAFIFGSPTWTQAAISNYIAAKMMWNPKLDADDLQREWLTRAYGNQAGAVMEVLYQELDNWFAEYFRMHSDAKYTPTESLFKDLFAPHYARLETLFMEAQAQPMTDLQRQRLELIRQNLVVLQWRLRSAGYLPEDYQSPLYRGDNEVVNLLLARHADFSYFPNVPGFRYRPPLTSVNIQMDKPPQNLPVSPIPNSSYFLMYSKQSGKIEMDVADIQRGSSYLSYTFYTFDGKGNKQTYSSGLLYDGQKVLLDVKAKTAYYLYISPDGIQPAPRVSWKLFFPEAVAPQAHFLNGTLYLQGPSAPLYIVGDSRKINAAPRGVTLATAPALQDVQKRYRDVHQINLDRQWRFLPDEAKNRGVVKPAFNDSSWKIIDAHDWWQHQGIDYHGVAWYRKTFTMGALAQGQRAILHFGAVDGKALVFLNGQHVGTHRLDSDFAGWDESFLFDVTKFLISGKNVLAVQVTSKSANTASGIQGAVNLLWGTPR